MRTKKYKNNEYVLAEDVWVRNPYGDAEPVDVNDLSNDELDLFLRNETKNISAKDIKTDGMNDEPIENVVICSDGLLWDERQMVLAELPNKKVKVIGVNGSLAGWRMVGDLSDRKRIMSFYLVNNPYRECSSYLPRRHRYYPNLIASTKTCPEFLANYQERPIFYRATRDINYSGLPRDGCMVLDDYRNPVCAAVSFCVARRVKRLALLCCDEAFGEERPASVRMKNGLYQYPQQIKSQRIIDRQFHWLKAKGVQLADCSSGEEYENATYIKPEELASFFGTT